MVIFLSLRWYFFCFQAHRRDGSLVARINQLERDLLVKKKENSILEDLFSTAQVEVRVYFLIIIIKIIELTCPLNVYHKASNRILCIRYMSVLDTLNW